MYEESIRVPMIWNHPAAIKPRQTITSMVSSYDLFPTMLDYAGISAQCHLLCAAKSHWIG